MKTSILSIMLVTCTLLMSCGSVEEKPNTAAKQPANNAQIVKTKSVQTQTKPSGKHGYFTGKVQTEWLDSREMKLLSTLNYVDPNGVTWQAPKNSKVDGASIPKMLWSMMGSPFTGKYRNASVIHDVACEEKKRPWKTVHKAFFHAMRASDVGPLKAKMMYAAVNNFGPRWKTGGTRGGGKAESRLSETDFKKLTTAIEKAEASGNPMTLEQIQNFQK